jgi:FO synthase
VEYFVAEEGAWLMQSVTRVAPDLSLGLASLLEKAIEGQPLTREEAYRLVRATGPELTALVYAAGVVRDRGRGQRVTYSRKVFIPLTRLCRDFCGYCTFRQDPSSAQQLYMTPEEVLEVAKAGEGLGCTEALFTLGERPEQRYPQAREWLERRGYRTTLQYLTDMCKLVVEETSLLPHANPEQ